MDIVFGNIDVLLTDNKTKISENVIKQIKKINSKTALRRDMAQVAYFIIIDKEIEDEVKLDLIKKLQEIYDKAQKELAKKKNIQEEPDDRVKNQQIDVVTRVGLAKQPNKNGNLLQSFNIHVESPKYPISDIDQVNNFLTDLTDEFEILMKPEDAEELLLEKENYKIETTEKFVPKNFKKGKKPNDDKKNSAAPNLDDVEDAETVSNSSPSEDESVKSSTVKSQSVSLGGKKRKTRKTRKNRKNTGGSNLSLSQQRELRDTLKTRRKGTPYPRPRTTPKTLNEIGNKFLDNLFFPRDKRAYLQLERMKNVPTKVEDLENRTQTNDFVQEAKEDPFAQGYASLANKNKDQLDNLIPEEQEFFNNLSYADQDFLIEKATENPETKAAARKKAEAQKELAKRFYKKPTVTAIQVAKAQNLYDNTRTYTPKELRHGTQTISKPLQKEIDAILEQRRNEAVKAVEQYEREKEEELYNSLGGKKRKTKKNKKKNQKRKTSKRKQKQK